MITARRAALLGLTTPLTAIMVALLGLWPEADDPTPDIPTAFVEVGGGMTAARAAEVRRQNASDDDAPRVARQNSLIVALVTAAITEGLM